MKTSPPDILSDLYVMVHTEGVRSEMRNLLGRAHDEIQRLRRMDPYAIRLAEAARKARNQLATLEAVGVPPDTRNLIRELDAALAKNQPDAPSARLAAEDTGVAKPMKSRLVKEGSTPSASALQSNAQGVSYCGRCDEDTPTVGGKCPICTKLKP